MNERPVTTESATIYDITAQRCPLCNGRLARSWDDTEPRRCVSCGARIRLGVQR
jgi:uncharacterized protein (DUF983 family)